jgi:hypothetical protein
MAMVEVIGNLIRELSTSSGLQAGDALSSYVLTRTLRTLTKFLDLPTKFPFHRLAITRAAVEMLSDKTSGVRRGAMGDWWLRILGGLCMGLLGLGEWVFCCFLWVFVGAYVSFYFIGTDASPSPNANT